MIEIDMTSKATFKDEQFHLLLLPSGAFMESESWEEGREVAMHFLPSSERIFFTVSAVAGHCDFVTASQRTRLWDQCHFRWLLRLKVLSLMSWCSLCIMTIKLFGISLGSFIWLLFSAVGENYFIKKHSPTGKLTLSRLEYIWNSQVYRPGN